MAGRVFMRISVDVKHHERRSLTLILPQARSSALASDKCDAAPFRLLPGSLGRLKPWAGKRDLDTVLPCVRDHINVHWLLCIARIQHKGPVQDLMSRLTFSLLLPTGMLSHQLVLHVIPKGQVISVIHTARWFKLLHFLILVLFSGCAHRDHFRV